MRENPDLNVDSGGIPFRLIYGSKEARVLLGNMPEPTFRRLTRKDGPLKTKKIGSKVYVEREVLNAFIAGLPSAETERAS